MFKVGYVVPQSMKTSLVKHIINENLNFGACLKLVTWLLKT